MIRTVLFIFRPETEWDAMFRVKRSMAFILGRGLLPIMLMASIWEGSGLVAWRKWHAGTHGWKDLTLGEAVVWETMLLALMLVVIATCAYLIKLASEPFNRRYRNSYRQALTLVVFSLNPLFLFQFAGALPRISLWIPWIIGILFSLRAIYYGIPRLLASDPDVIQQRTRLHNRARMSADSAGMFFVSALFLVGMMGAERFLFIRCFYGQGVKVENLVFDIASKLPF